MYTSCKIWKKTLLKWHYLCFFTTLDLNCPKFGPKITPTFFFFFFFFFADFQWNMLGDSININCLCCNTVILKKKKKLVNCFIGSNLHKKRVSTSQIHNEKQIFGSYNKSRSSAFRKFLFYQKYHLADLWIFFYLEWCFSSKKCHFQQKQLFLGNLVLYHTHTHTKDTHHTHTDAQHTQVPVDWHTNINLCLCHFFYVLIKAALFTLIE